jgi:hypothetical protein
MNGFGTALAWSSVTVTLVASTAFILERMASSCRLAYGECATAGGEV